MLMPKRTKFRKQMKGRNRGYATRGASLATGEFALKAVEAGRGKLSQKATGLFSCNGTLLYIIIVYRYYRIK